MSSATPSPSNDWRTHFAPEDELPDIGTPTHAASEPVMSGTVVTDPAARPLVEASREIDHVAVAHWCKIIAKAFDEWLKANDWVPPRDRDRYRVLFVLGALRDDRTPDVGRIRDLLITDVCPCEACDEASKIINDAWDAHPRAVALARELAVSDDA